MELECQRKDGGRQEEEVTEEPKRFMMQKMARGFSLFEEEVLVFEAQDQNVERYMKVAAAVQNAIQCHRVTYDEKKKELLPRHHWIVFSRGQIELNPARNRTCAVCARHEWNCSLPSVSYCWWSFSSTISHLLSLLQSVTLLACSLNASPCMPAIILHYCTFQGTVL